MHIGDKGAPSPLIFPRDERLLTRAEVCSMVAMSESQLNRKVANGTFPPPSHCDGERWVRWSLSDVIAWIEQNRLTDSTKKPVRASQARA